MVSLLYEELTARDGATYRPSITPGLSGYVPLFLNLSKMFMGVSERGHALPTSDAMVSVVITRPGCCAIYFLHSLS